MGVKIRQSFSIEISKLKEYEYNNKIHTEEQIQRLTECIKQCGFNSPVIIDEDNVLIAGHARVQAAKHAGLEEVSCIRAEGLTPEQIRAYRIADNKIAAMALDDYDNLLKELHELKEVGFDTEFTGWQEEEFNHLTEETPIKGDDFEELTQEEIQEIKTDIKQGDIIQLGQHRLMCGDSTKESDFELLMNGQLATMVLTDSPYNVKMDDIVNQGKIQHQDFLMASGEMTETEFIEFLKQYMTNCHKFSKDGSIHYHFMDWKHIFEIITAGREVYSIEVKRKINGKIQTVQEPTFKQLCIWNKKNGGMGTFYRSQHELIFIFKKGEAKHINNFELGQHGRYRTNVWDCDGQNSFSRNAEALQSGETRDLELHPTVKPIELLCEPIMDCSNYDDIILDCFGGSGSTLMAAEEKQRRAYLMELDPKYCEVICQRWEKYTSGMREKLN